MPANAGSAPRRFAEVVFQIATEEGRLDAWENDLELLAQVFQGDMVIPWLANPSVPASDKDALIDTGLASTSQEIRNLGRLLVSRGRADLAARILAEYRSRLDEARGIVHARVTTALELADAERTAIAERLTRMTGRQVKMETAVDPSIIGGIVVRIGDRLIDGSARARLLALKRRLAGAAL